MNLSNNLKIRLKTRDVSQDVLNVGEVTSNFLFVFSDRQMGLYPVARGRTKRPDPTLRPLARSRGRPDPEEPGRSDADRPGLGRGRQVSFARRDAIQRRSADDDEDAGRRLVRKFCLVSPHGWGRGRR